MITLMIIIACDKQEFDQNQIHDQQVKSVVAGTELTYITLYSETFTITSKDALTATRVLNSPDIADGDDFTITVRNGKGKYKVTKMEIRVDGKLLITYKNFKGKSSFTKSLSSITPSSILQVKIEGSRGRFIEVIIKGTSKFSSVSDIEGNVYRTVRIGDQWWMAENLKSTKLNDGTQIPQVTDNAEWLNVSAEHLSAFSWYNNNSDFKDTYGALYNWEAAGKENVCPTGWRLPDEQDYYELCLYIDPESAMGNYSDVAGGALKEAGLEHWESPNEGATDEYGFRALPGGYRNVVGSFVSLGTVGSWWSDNGLASMGMSYADTRAGFSEGGNEYGRSIRCIKE